MEVRLAFLVTEQERWGCALRSC